jgi:[ribosomal protein S5]-alanine N-acetyltransferase
MMLASSMESSRTQLVTARLVLRPVECADLEPLQEIWGDPAVMAHMGRGTRDAAASLERVRELIDHQRRHGFGKWATIERATGDLIGYCGVELYENGPDVELGFCFARSAWGRGYATEAARAWLEHCFAALGFSRVLALVKPGNPPSIRVLEKLGMKEVGPTEVAGSEWLLYEALSPPP